MKHLERPEWRKRETGKRRRRLLIAAALVLLAPLAAVAIYVLDRTDAFSTGGAAGDARLPAPERDGDKIHVRRGESFQKALEMARPGDTILLEAGATFRGAFRLPAREGERFITIRTSAGDELLPPPDTRLDPEKHARHLPKLESDVKGAPVVFAGRGAHHYRFVGIEFRPTIEGLYNIIQLGTTDETDVADLPHHIEFDRVYLHGDEKHGQRRGIAANGKHIVIKNSYFGEFKRKGEESQAIAAWATDGPLLIENNYLEAAAESVLFGGAENRLGLVVADVVVSDNHMHKPPEWRGQGWVVKNFFEIKSGRRMKIERNLMTNNWAMAQEGTGILFRVGEDSGRQAVVEDIVFSDNIVRGAGSAVNIFGGEGRGGRRLTIRNNVFEDIDAEKWEGRGFFIKATDFEGVVIENNTVIHTGSISIAYGKPVTGFVFRGNIVFRNEYGFFGDGGLIGRPTLTRHFPGAVLTHNVIVGGDARDYGPDNFYPVSVRQIGFRDPAASDYRLRENSPYRERGLRGGPVGADLDPASVGGK